MHYHILLLGGWERIVDIIKKKKTTTQENNKITRGEGRNNNKLIDKKQFSHKTH